MKRLLGNLDSTLDMFELLRKDCLWVNGQGGFYMTCYGHKPQRKDRFYKNLMKAAERKDN